MIGRSDVFDESEVDVSDEVHPPSYGKLNDAVREALDAVQLRDPDWWVKRKLPGAASASNGKTVEADAWRTVAAACLRTRTRSALP